MEQCVYDTNTKEWPKETLRCECLKVTPNAVWSILVVLCLFHDFFQFVL